MKLTKTTKSFDNISANQKWVLIDADGKTLGRLATDVAEMLRGKNKPQYTPHNDCGDFVIIVNAEKIKLTGKKLTDKEYFHHSLYVSGMKTTAAGKMLEKKPEEVIFSAVKSMLPKNKLSDRLLTKLKVYKGATHPHTAQMPTNKE
ncbi:MAG: 50S ribosomal protein L13 [Pseudomonadota bacterium]